MSTFTSHRVLSIVVAISLVVGTAVVFAAMTHATNHMRVTM
jgi:hypothetical protein